MRVWLYMNRHRTKATAVCCDDTLARVLRIAEDETINNMWDLGNLIDQCMQGLPTCPEPLVYYPTPNGGLTSAVGHLWEIDRTLEKVATFWCRGEQTC